MTSLSDVFGIAEHVKTHSYVDRGGLDSQLRYALDAERHIAVHGASKQGKSWLRSNVLGKDASLLVQCQTGTTLESVLTDALGALGVRAELRRTAGTDFEGKLDFRGSGTVGAQLLGKLGLELNTGSRALRSNQTESQPVGQTPGNLRWVAHTILASERRLVVEDCHYLPDPIMQELAFVLKALGGYGVHVLVAGIWTRNHLLTYHNGDLEGRVEDIHLTWSEDDLDAVLLKGCRALNIAMSTSLRRQLIADAAGNVGLLQHLAEAICREENIFNRTRGAHYLTPGPALDRARWAVADSMRPRFQLFVENFDEAVRRVRSTIHDAQAVIRALLKCSDDELVGGISDAALATRTAAAGTNPMSTTSVQEVLGCLPQAHDAMEIRPPVITYNAHTRKVHLTDRSLLFFRRYGTPRWPWLAA